MRFLPVILIAVIFCSFCSCWDYTEYEDMALVFAMAIDTEENGNMSVVIETSNMFSNQSGGDSSGSRAEKKGIDEIHIATAETIPEAIDELQQILEREVFLGYIRVIIIGEETAKKHMDEIMSYISITPRIRSSVDLLVCEGRAIDALSTYDITGATSIGEKIEDILKNSSRGGVIFPVSLGEFTKMLGTQGIEPVLPIIRIEKANTNQKNASGACSSRIQITAGAVSTTMGHSIISSMAVFDGLKMKGRLDTTESEGISLLKNKIKGSHISLRMPLEQGGPSVPVSCRITDSGMKIKSSIINRKPVFTLKVHVTAVLEQYIYTKIIITPDVLDKIESALSQNVKSIITSTMDSIQNKYRTDVIGFGFNIFQNNTKEWRETYRDRWKEIFPNVAVDTMVDAKILNSGAKNSSSENK